MDEVRIAAGQRTCAFCGRSYSSSSTLRRHVQEMHDRRVVRLRSGRTSAASAPAAAAPPAVGACRHTVRVGLDALGKMLEAAGYLENDSVAVQVVWEPAEVSEGPPRRTEPLPLALGLTGPAVVARVLGATSGSGSGV